MRLADRLVEHGYRGLPLLAVGELHIEVDLNVGDMVAVLALGAMAGAADVEACGFGPLDGNGVDIHRRAPSYSDQ
jgi:hypothetical protein